MAAVADGTCCKKHYCTAALMSFVLDVAVARSSSTVV
jgi:hypothetical protein